MGVSESMADRTNEFIKSKNSGRVLANSKWDEESTTPTIIEEFTQTLLHVYSMD